MPTTHHPSPEERARAILDPAVANRDRLEFVLALSHELRTPVGIITGYASLARQGEVSPEEALEVVDLHASELSALLELLLKAANTAGSDQAEAWDASLRHALANSARAQASIGSVIEDARRGRRSAKSSGEAVGERRDQPARTARDELAALVTVHPRELGSLPLSVVARLLDALETIRTQSIGA